MGHEWILSAAIVKFTIVGSNGLAFALSHALDEGVREICVVRVCRFSPFTEQDRQRLSASGVRSRRSKPLPSSLLVWAFLLRPSARTARRTV
jgi:hypothetical protein